jgi:hypothetical protein
MTTMAWRNPVVGRQQGHHSAGDRAAIPLMATDGTGEGRRLEGRLHHAWICSVPTSLCIKIIPDSGRFPQIGEPEQMNAPLDRFIARCR